MFMELAGGAACASAGLMAYGVRSRSSSLFAPSVWRGRSGRRSIALTFDDGPSESTPLLLETLAREGVQASFFQCGVNAARLPEIAREVAGAGHEIGNHSHSHPRFWFRTAGFMEREIGLAQAAIEKAAGKTPALFRVPYGARWFGLGRAQRGAGLMGVMWTVLGLDWKLRAAAIVARLAGAVSNGAIVCLHDGRELVQAPDISQTIEAVKRAIPELRARGFQFETVSQIICPTI